MPPPGAHFNQEWGLTGMFQGNTGDWQEYPYETVYDYIEATAGVDLGAAEAAARDATHRVTTTRATLDSILTAWLDENPGDSYLAKVRQEVDDVVLFDARRAAEGLMRTGPVMTRDSVAVGQGIIAAPHQAVAGRAMACLVPYFAAGQLADRAERAASHIDRQQHRQRQEVPTAGSYVFIGHGRSSVWRELKDFVQDRLKLRVDEFERVPTAGTATVTRLAQMLDDAAIALIVLTAEDELTDGKTQARQNVIHEAGLFQGRLGFDRAIVVLEEGCEEFSNITGLGQIRFPKGDISAKFENVRRLFEREGLVAES